MLIWNKKKLIQSDSRWQMWLRLWSYMRHRHSKLQTCPTVDCQLFVSPWLHLKRTGMYCAFNTLIQHSFDEGTVILVNLFRHSQSKIYPFFARFPCWLWLPHCLLFLSRVVVCLSSEKCVNLCQVYDWSLGANNHLLLISRVRKPGLSW